MRCSDRNISLGRGRLSGSFRSIQSASGRDEYIVFSRASNRLRRDARIVDTEDRIGRTGAARKQRYANNQRSKYHAKRHPLGKIRQR